MCHRRHGFPAINVLARAAGGGGGRTLNTSILRRLNHAPCCLNRRSCLFHRREIFEAGVHDPYIALAIVGLSYPHLTRTPTVPQNPKAVKKMQRKSTEIRIYADPGEKRTKTPKRTPSISHKTNQNSLLQKMVKKKR